MTRAQIIFFIIVLLLAIKVNIDLWSNPGKTEREILMEYFK